MALMTFHEGDQARWIGVRPGHRGTQISVEENEVNNTKIVHTVTDGKVLYLYEASLFATANVTGNCYLSLRDAADGHIRFLMAFKQIINVFAHSLHWTCWPPLEIPEKYDICVRSDAAGLVAYGAITGWEE